MALNFNKPNNDNKKIEKNETIIRELFNALDFFNKVNANEATCKICHKQIKCKGASTSGLRRHLDGQHKINPMHFNEKIDALTTSGKFSLASFVKPKNYNEMISKLIVMDRIPLQTITNSEVIRTAFKSLGYKLPNSSTTLNTILFNEYKNIQKKI